MKEIEVEVQSDIIEKLSKSNPIQAISELVWNGVDADANHVVVNLSFDGMDTLEAIYVIDDGAGIPYDQAESLFKRLGGSWKANANKTKKAGRYLHGKEGRGRFKAFSLGRFVRWKVVYKKEGDGKLWEYEIEIFRESIRKAKITDEKLSKAPNSGVTVEILEVEKNFKSLESQNAIQAISENFAIYLKNYKGVSLIYDGNRVDPNAFIESTNQVDLNNIQDEDGTKYAVELEIISWNTNTEKRLYICNQQGFPYYPLQDKRFHVGDYNFSAYLKSKFLELEYQKNTLGASELNPSVNEVVQQAVNEIKAYFLDKAAQKARFVVDQWKQENVYPYEKEPKTLIEEVERKVFDIVAVKVNDNLPEFSDSTPRSKKLSLKLLKQSIEKDPDDLRLILDEVLNLPKKSQKELAELLHNTTLSAIINASKVISDRMKFITGLEEILFDRDLKKHTKERSQLHRILVDHTWIFGEEFNLSVDDQSLTEVLRKHHKRLGSEVVIDKAVTRVDGKKGIVDLMLSRQLSGYNETKIEHLVIELKAPKVKLSKGELDQIEDYAFAVSADERFRNLQAKWNFWLIADDFDDVVKKKIKQNNRQEGILYQSDRGDNPQITVWVKTWGQVLKENKARLQFFREKLEYQVDKGDALKSLTENYKSLIEGTTVEKIVEDKLLESDNQ